MLFPYPWCLLHAGRLFSCIAYGVQCPILLSMPEFTHFFCFAPADRQWSSVGHNFIQAVPSLCHILELQKEESCVKRITSLFQTINILWVCWAQSHVKLCYSISTHRRALSKSRNSGGCSRCLTDTEITPATAQSLFPGAWSHRSLS